jgi:photosystem II stability/assembly factor-like uncharacterized protein
VSSFAFVLLYVALSVLIDPASGQGATEIMTIGNRTTMFLSTHSQTWGRDWQSWQMHSNDSGHTWSKPESMPGRLAKFTFIRGHIVTRDGRILIPFQHYLGPPEGTPEPPLEEKPWHKTLAHYVGNPRNGVLISRDGGKTFSEHGNIRITDRIIHGANYTRCHPRMAIRIGQR